MIFTMIGGGAHRLLATSRSALHQGAFLNGGEIRFYDLNEKRAADMAAMLMKSPEYRKCPVKVSWQLTLDEALKDADLVSVTLLAGPHTLLNLESAISSASGFLGTDNISYAGAFLALRGAPILMNIAKRMEVMCPDAILLDFANPVAVLSAMVRQFTSIRCYGICAGHNNHTWDLNRILKSEDAPNEDFDVDVAGINHFSFITRGTLYGEDLFALLDRRLSEVPDTVERIKFPDYQPLYVQERMRDGLRKLIDIYKTRHALLFSTEGDGFSHLYHEEVTRNYISMHANLQDMNGFDTRAAAANKEFARLGTLPADEIPWNQPEYGTFCMASKGDIQSKILAGLAGSEVTRVAVSSVNEGTITNMENGLATEFTHIVDKNGLHPIENLRVPTNVLGMVTSLSVHQTLLAKACGTGSATDLYEALITYPIGADSKAARELWRALLNSSKNYIAPSFMDLEKYL